MIGNQPWHHAESMALIRAYYDQPGPLPRELTLYINRDTCTDCKRLLPGVLGAIGVDRVLVVMKSGKTHMIENGLIELDQKSEFSGGVGPLNEEAGPDLDDLRERFWKYTPPTRYYERSGLICWRSDPELNCGVNLHIQEHPDLGFNLQWTIMIPFGMSGESHMTVGDANKLTEADWIDAADDCFILTGCFVPLETAWNVIEDFFSDPLTLSPKATWVDCDDLPEQPEP